MVHGLWVRWKCDGGVKVVGEERMRSELGHGGDVGGQEVLKKESLEMDCSVLYAVGSASGSYHFNMCLSGLELCIVSDSVVIVFGAILKSQITSPIISLVKSTRKRKRTSAAELGVGIGDLHEVGWTDGKRMWLHNHISVMFSSFLDE
eukprot:scaffold4506_cov176-Ochromonas_danica.AAC.1